MRQNFTIALLSVIATLLFVVVIQNSFGGRDVIMAQTGGGAGATVGPFGVATGTLQGSDAAGFWIYNPDKSRIMVYDWNRNQLRLRAVRDMTFDTQLVDFNLTGQKGPTVKDAKSLAERAAARK